MNANNSIKVAALVGLVQNAEAALQQHADDLRADVDALMNPTEGLHKDGDRVNFAIGALLPLEKLAADLAALVAAARAVQTI